MCLAWTILVPVNVTNDTLEKAEDVTFSNIDKLSISNIPLGSPRFWTHIVMAYIFTFWTIYVLNKEYATVGNMRSGFFRSEERRPDRFTVLVKNVPPDPDELVSELVEHFFLVNHPGHYLTHQVVHNARKLDHLVGLVREKEKKKNLLDYYQLINTRSPLKRPMMKTGFLGLCGDKVDAIDHYTSDIERLSNEIAAERERVTSDPKSIIPAAFVSFKTRWAAAVCAQTQQFKNPTRWLTEWTVEPRDVIWTNLAVPHVQLIVGSRRRHILAVTFFFLNFSSIFLTGMILSLADIDGIEETVAFLKPVIQVKVIELFIETFLPWIVFKIYGKFLSSIFTMLTEFEGIVSISALERRSASQDYMFLFVNIFLGSIIEGTALGQLNSFLKLSASDIPKTIGQAIPMNATFFISYVMVDGWTGNAGEILRFSPLISYHFKNIFLVKTEKDREKAMDPGSLGFDTGEPQIFFLLGFVYAVVTPLLLPFILVFFASAYVVYRHQIINVYNQEYESGAAFWPDVHGRIISALIISQLLLMCLLSTKKAALATTSLIALPILTIWFHIYCKGHYEPAFVKFPLQEAMMKDTIERAREPNLNLKGYLQNAYVHPGFKDGDENAEGLLEKYEQKLVPTKRRKSRPVPSIISDHGSSPASVLELT